MPFGHFTRTEIAPNRFHFTRDEETLFVSQAMNHKVVTVQPDQTLQSAAARMKETGVDILPVCANDRLIGVLTDKDLGEGAAAKGLDPLQATVGQAMTPHALTCFEDQTIAAARKKMEDRKVRRLLVLDRAKQLIGVLSLDDLKSPH